MSTTSASLRTTSWPSSSRKSKVIDFLFRAPVWTEALTVFSKDLFGGGSQDLDDCLLDEPVRDGWDAQLAFVSIVFGYLHHLIGDGVYLPTLTCSIILFLYIFRIDTTSPFVSSAPLKSLVQGQA